MKKIIITILAIALSLGLSYGQENMMAKKGVVVYLKDGSAISGNLVSWTYGEDVSIESQGIQMTFPHTEVLKVVEQKGALKIKVPPVHKNTGTYYTVKAQMISGNPGRRSNERLGYGITMSAGYLWNQYLGVGLGTGYREYIVDDSEALFPVFAEIKGFIGDGAVRPTYNLELGYAFAQSDIDNGLLDAKGGWTIYPSIGLSTGRKEMKTTLDIGYNFQKANYTYGWNPEDANNTVQDLTYRRLSVRLGVHF